MNESGDQNSSIGDDASNIPTEPDRRAQLLIEVGTSGDPDDLMDTATLAAWLGVSKQWCELGRNRGYGQPAIYLSPRCVRYRRETVLRWLDSRMKRRSSDTTAGANASTEPRADGTATRGTEQ